MSQPLISVIVPIYGIERYVGTCIESIMEQSYENLEIILVDDGGKDRCPEICNLYQSKDDRIKVIHKANGGLVSARKAGLRAACGSYVSYVDGDDWIGPDFIESLFLAAESSGADLVCAGQTRTLFTKTAELLNECPEGVYEGESLTELWKKMLSCGSFYKPGIYTYVWDKLFKKEILMEPQLSVDERISIGEDGAVTYPALLNCKKVAVIGNCSYRYRQREDSMLKQRASISAEAQKLKYLHDYMLAWAETTNPELKLIDQVTDYVLSIAIMRSGGSVPQCSFSAYGSDLNGRRIAVYSSGTFGQQLVSRLEEADACELAVWLDDDYREYRRCCLNVDPVERVLDIPFDYLLIAAVNSELSEKIAERLTKLGVEREKILQVSVPDDRRQLLRNFLDVDAIKAAENKH